MPDFGLRSKRRILREGGRGAVIARCTASIDAWAATIGSPLADTTDQPWASGASAAGTEALERRGVLAPSRPCSRTTAIGCRNATACASAAKCRRRSFEEGLQPVGN